jgi:hypothetical protein
LEDSSLDLLLRSRVEKNPEPHEPPPDNRFFWVWKVNALESEPCGHS